LRRGDRYGLHRVLEPLGVMPQAATKLDNTMVCWDNEILLDVEMLNIDSASFTQIKQAAHNDPEQVKRIMLQIVEERGKHHNPVTDSGGMLIGRVAQIGERLDGHLDLHIGDRIATLVSLTLTPLQLHEIQDVHLDSGQVKVKGQAILFETGLYAKLPDDLPDAVSLAVLDVAGAPAQTARMVREGDTVVILGAGGKSGLLVLYQARKSTGPNGTVIAIEFGEDACRRLEATGWADSVLNLDATNAIEVMQAVEHLTHGKLADITINCVNIPGTEMASILCTRDGGKVYFFSMATRFTAAALGAEGAGKDVDMIIGNGYTNGHANLALQLLRENETLRSIYTAKFASSTDPSTSSIS
jgi:L-erythro-3,5-diaminohexanoate dehydrogenase